jgi:UDP-3-O-[3-hydroxymyristoyl] glucosamine N-acyltransferase
MLETSYTLSEIAKLLGAKLQGNPECKINGIAALDRAQEGQISFLSNAQLRSHLATTQASAIILAPKEAEFYSKNALIMDNPYLGYAKVAALFQPKLTAKSGVHKTAVVGDHCQIASSASIGANVVIGDRVVIGEKTIVGHGCVIADDTTIGIDCCLWPRVAIYPGVHIANRVLIHSGVVIGSDGFGMANDNGVWQKIPQLGSVDIGDDVEIGANTTIDRGALDNTVIEQGVKLDNQIQIAHNVHIGAHTAIAACTAIAGSTKIGKYCMIGGGASIVGHIEIVDKVILVGTAVVEKSITEPGVYGSGTGILPFRELKKSIIRFRQLDDIAHRLQKLEKAKQ